MNPIKPHPDPELLSFVIPVYNEEENMQPLRSRLEAVVEKMRVESEYIFICDGCTDGTVPFLIHWARENEDVKLLILSRNFGHQASITAGLDHAEGDAVVIMDGDLQDPPEVVPQLLEKYREGYDIVLGKRKVRQGEGWLKRTTARLFYWLMNKFIQGKLPKNVGDFRLISREVVQTLTSMREYNRFLRGMMAWLGYEQTEVLYERQGRASGKPKFSYAKLTMMAFDAITSFSSLPLKAGFYTGIVLFLFGGAVAVYAILRRYLIDDFYRGWATLVVLQCTIGGSILIFVGLTGLYIARIFDEVKCRPLYIVRQAVNIKPRPAGRALAEKSGDAEYRLLP